MRIVGGSENNFLAEHEGSRRMKTELLIQVNFWFEDNLKGKTRWMV